VAADAAAESTPGAVCDHPFDAHDNTASISGIGEIRRSSQRQRIAMPLFP
jgi:hypothetical protein